jgi:hypothetical protein
MEKVWKNLSWNLPKFVFIIELQEIILTVILRQNKFVLKVSYKDYILVD